MSSGGHDMLHTGMRLTGIQRGVERVDDMRCAAQLPKHVMYNNVIIIILLLFSSQTKISAHTKFIYAQTHTGICTRIRTHTSASTRTIIQCVIVIYTKSCKYAFWWVISGHRVWVRTVCCEVPEGVLGAGTPGAWLGALAGISWS